MNANKLAAKITALGKLELPNLYKTIKNVDFPASASEKEESSILGLQNLKQNDTLTIIGAGVTGLTTAWFVNKARPDVKIRILDNRNRIGGWMETTQNKFGFFESGPRTLLPGHTGTTAILSILKDIGRLDLVGGVPKTADVNEKALLYNDEIQLTPTSMLNAIPFMFNPLLKDAKLEMLSGVISKKFAEFGQDESVHSYISRTLGSRVAERMVSALMRGIYAGDSTKLSARSVARLNRFYYIEKLYHQSILPSVLKGSVSTLESYSNNALKLAYEMISGSECSIDDVEKLQNCSIYGFSQGINPAVKAIADDLTTKGVDIKLNSTVKTIANGNNDNVQLTLDNGSQLSSDIVVSTIAKPGMFDKSIGEWMEKVPYNTLAVVNVYVPDSRVAKKWFGILLPRTEDAANENQVIGVIFDSSIRSSMGVHSDGSNMTVMIGGDLWKESTEAELRQKALNGLHKLLGPFDDTEAVVNVRIQRNCIPQLNVGHSKIQSAVHAGISSFYNQRVALAGMAFGRGCGVSDCVIDALTLGLRFHPDRHQLDHEFYYRHYLATTQPDLFI
ncbi:oxygen-dependent protoporphyrinogen oxidase [Starmerella bacillaris]|uniref:Protoporphyrinogen oxidase n=1 Tax=Starmerella bacillaris TaxID=1247836 RepID=A0AAV5RKJ0_STABA|nr:oxygen-dependent protoporphyrinogen oxidase [Starmerella bacillaris]